jgi:hypothetical protein
MVTSDILGQGPSTCQHVSKSSFSYTNGSASLEDGVTAGRGKNGGNKMPAHPAALRALRIVHTLIWFSVESSMAYVLYAGLAGRSDRRAAAVGTVVAVESLVFLVNGARCPLTELAIPLGGDRAPVTDIYLPRSLAHNLPIIHLPLIVAAILLHVRNLRRSRRKLR